MRVLYHLELVVGPLCLYLFFLCLEIQSIDVFILFHSQSPVLTQLYISGKSQSPTVLLHFCVKM